MSYVFHAFVFLPQASKNISRSLHVVVVRDSAIVTLLISVLMIKELGVIAFLIIFEFLINLIKFLLIKGTVMQIEKAQINDRLRVSEVS